MVDVRVRFPATAPLLLAPFRGTPPRLSDDTGLEWRGYIRVRPWLSRKEHRFAMPEARGSSPLGCAKQVHPMPTYEYVCYNCNKVREVVKAMSDYGTPVTCPRCGERMMRFWGKKAAAVHFRGKGWTGAQRRG